jgi:hypothetical protein
MKLCIRCANSLDDDWHDEEEYHRMMKQHDDIDAATKLLWLLGKLGLKAGLVLKGEI